MNEYDISDEDYELLKAFADREGLSLPTGTDGVGEFFGKIATICLTAAARLMPENVSRT